MRLHEIFENKAEKVDWIQVVNDVIRDENNNIRDEFRDIASNASSVASRAQSIKNSNPRLKPGAAAVQAAHEFRDQQQTQTQGRKNPEPARGAQPEPTKKRKPTKRFTEPKTDLKFDLPKPLKWALDRYQLGAKIADKYTKVNKK